MNKIIWASDHRGFALKDQLVNYYQQQGYECLKLGAFSDEPVDYPDVAKQALQQVINEPATIAILICGSGIGMSMIANRFSDIRCVYVAQDPLIAQLGRSHNNANVLAIGADLVNFEQSCAIINLFLNTPFDNQARHIRRLNKLCCD